MKKRKLGGSGLELAPLALGGNVFGWTVDEPTSFKLLDAFLAAGFNFVDTADVYSRFAPGNRGGESETILGDWIRERGNRDSVLIATKVGMEMRAGKKGLSRKYISGALDDSLRRLQTDYIDLYQAHTDDASTPLEETLAAFDDALREGKVRAIGASNYSAGRLAAALTTSREKGLSRFESLQPLYNLYDRSEYEKELEPLCRKENLGVLTYFSLASGFLTGKYRAEKDLRKSQRGQRVRQYLNERGFRILEALDSVASRYRTSPAQISLAWISARPGITASIASATNLDQLNELIQAANLELDAEAMKTLNEASAWN